MSETSAKPEPRTRTLIPIAAAALAVVLAGCSVDSASLSSINLNPFSGDTERSRDYNYFYKRDARGPGMVASADLIGPDGHCAFESAPASAAPYPATTQAAPPAAQPQASEPINPRSNQALYFTAGPQANPQQPSNLPSTGAPPPATGRDTFGIALQMTECQVVQLAGTTDRVEIGAEGGRRSVVLTYMAGPRPGIYRFTDGRLTSMERVEVPAAPKKQAPRKKTAKAKQPT